MNEANSLRRTLTAFGAIAIILAATGAGRADDGAETFRKAFLAGELDWEAVTAQAAKEKAVNFYYWGGDDALNVWVDRTVAPAMKTAGVKLNPVRITSTKDAVDLVLTELGSGRGPGEGSVDLVWINGENFYTLAQQNALCGQFRRKTSQFEEFHLECFRPAIDTQSARFRCRRPRPREMPWSGEQYVCAVNRAYAAASVTPSTFDEMKTYLEANPGKFTYVKPPHYVGNTFVQEVIYAFNPDGNGADPFQKSIEELGADELARLITPGLGYLKSTRAAACSAPRREAALSRGYRRARHHVPERRDLFRLQIRIVCGGDQPGRTGRYPETAKEMVFPKGLMIKNKNYLAIPLNSPNPASGPRPRQLYVFRRSPGVETETSRNARGHRYRDAVAGRCRRRSRIAAPVHFGVTQADSIPISLAGHQCFASSISSRRPGSNISNRGSDKPIAEIVADAVSKQARN